jgi:hypothetical protein
MSDPLRLRCPLCDSPRGMSTLGLTDPRATRPSAGDLVVCYRCGGVFFFTPDSALCLATNEELSRLPPRLLSWLRVICVTRRPLGWLRSEVIVQ